MLVDDDPKALAAAEEGLDVLTLRGDVTHRGVLERAEAHRADVAVAVTGHDAVVAAARQRRADGVQGPGTGTRGGDCFEASGTAPAGGGGEV